MDEKRQEEADYLKDSALYEVVRVLATAVFRTLMPVVFHGREKLDREAPYLLIANHRHALDPVAMAMGVRKRQVIFLAKKELGKNPLMAAILKKLHCILVDRHHTDMEAMRACVKTIRAGRILVIFPEGTRHHEGQMEQIENGTALLALRSRCPVIPVYIAQKLRLFHRTHLYVGDPIPCQDLISAGINAETCEKMNDRMRETYREMIRKFPEKGES